MSADYLAYALIDAIVDHYFVILEKLSEKIETMEDSLVINPTPQLLEKVYDLKKEMITLRKSVWPLRELISGLERTESKLIEKSTDVFLRDVYDHTIQVIDSIETFRDTVSGMMDLYLSSISNKMNQIMQVLTIIATIFIPLTFITGIYGMNFDPGASPFNMPELGWYWGYISVWVVMIVIVVLMLIYFRKKKWL
jgi:magnesium transporter